MRNIYFKVIKSKLITVGLFGLLALFSDIWKLYVYLAAG